MANGNISAQDPSYSRILNCKNNRMKTYKVLIAGFIMALMTLFSSMASAIPVMDVQLDDLMAQASDLRQSLNLTPNQQILWRQTESKMRTIAETRRRRREQLQADMKKGVSDPKTELRDLAKNLALEDDQSYQENKQLRELFLIVNDALDDKQRQAVLLLLSDHLQRVPDQGNDTKSCDQPKSRGTGRQRGGAGGVPQQQSQ
jgi:hypothetical protein